MGFFVLQGMSTFRQIMKVVCEHVVHVGLEQAVRH